MIYDFGYMYNDYYSCSLWDRMIIIKIIIKMDY